MPYRHRRMCPICFKPHLLALSNHLSQVHGLSRAERQPWLKRALRSPLPLPITLPMEQYPLNLSRNNSPTIPDNISPVPCLMDHRPRLSVHGLDTQPHPYFAFQHPYSMMVVDPSQCGKTYFVQQLLLRMCMTYPDKKPVLVCWFYNQWQSQYEELQRVLQSQIRFARGLPELEDDLRSIPTTRHTIIVLDDLMAQATDSPVVSKLFTQGRHRNASVIFPRGSTILTSAGMPHTKSYFGPQGIANKSRSWQNRPLPKTDHVSCKRITEKQIDLMVTSWWTIIPVRPMRSKS